MLLQGVQLPGLGSIALQPGGICSQQQTWPVLHLTGSLRQSELLATYSTAATLSNLDWNLAMLQSTVWWQLPMSK